MFDKFFAKLWIEPVRQYSLENLNDAALKAIKLAQAEAASLQQKFVGSEQILLGLIGEETGVIFEMFKSMGISLENARSEVKKIIGFGNTPGDFDRPFSIRAKQALQLASAAATQLGYDRVGPEHILLGLLRQANTSVDDNGVGIQVLKRLNVNLQNLEQQILKELLKSKPQKTKLILLKSPATSSKNHHLDELISGEISTRIAASLFSWVSRFQLGYVLSSKAEIKLDNGEIINPDVCYISKEQLKQSSTNNSQIVPQLAILIKSSPEPLTSVLEKMDLLFRLGTQVVLLINPNEHQIVIYRYKDEARLLNDGDLLKIPELFPGWEVPVNQIWPVIFD